MILICFSSGAGGKGALLLWPMFGSVNQLLAALALLLISIYIKKVAGNWYFLSLIPCIFMAAMTFWAVWLNQLSFLKTSSLLLIVLNGVIFLLAFWIMIEGFVSFFQFRRK